METWKLEHSTLTGEIRGNGPPVMFLSGLRHPRTMWDEVLARISVPVQSILVDWPGQGTSTEISRGIEVEQLASDTSMLIDRLGLGPLVVVGFSMGGMVALSLAAKDGKKLAKLALIGTSADPEPWIKRNGEYRVMLLLLSSLGWPFTVGPLMRFLRQDPARLFYSPEYLAEGDNFARMCEMIAHSGPSRDASLASAVVNRTGNTDDELGRIRVPTLVLRGERDKVRFQTESIRLSTKIPGSVGPCVNIPGAGHGVCAERPEEVSRILSKFLAESH